MLRGFRIAAAAGNALSCRMLGLYRAVLVSAYDFDLQAAAFNCAVAGGDFQDESESWKEEAPDCKSIALQIGVGNNRGQFDGRALTLNRK